jgi:hypothetical protein
MVKMFNSYYLMILNYRVYCLIVHVSDLVPFVTISILLWLDWLIGFGFFQFGLLLVKLTKRGRRAWSTT